MWRRSSAAPSVEQARTELSMMRAGAKSKHTILLLVDRRQSKTSRYLNEFGYHVITTYTPDHAVAICVNNKVDVVILDQQHFVETEGWSVAKSVKMVRTNICVILVVRGKVLTQDLPEGVDALLSEGDNRTLLQTLGKLLESGSRPNRASKA
jgi:response regulator RpfG family c-di-GMP phosphodiesterase